MKNKISKFVSAIMVGTLFITFSCKKPAASFTADKATAKVGETVTFTNSSIADAKAMWDFGDGTQSLSTQNTITHVYAKAGTYNVTLSAAKKNGKKPSEAPATVITVTEDKNPKALFTSKTTGVVGEILAFNSTSTDADELAWDFGDGTITTVSPVQTHVYTTNGTYVVTLTAFAKNSTLRNTYSSTITINGTNGDNATQSMLLGQWKMTNHVYTNTLGGTAVNTCTSNLTNLPYSTSTFAAGAKIEVRANGVIGTYDANNNFRSSGSYSVRNATQLYSWNHTVLYDVLGVFIPNSFVNTPAYGQNPWTITVLNATTLTITYNYTDPTASGPTGSSCTVANGRVVSETVTYTRL